MTDAGTTRHHLNNFSVLKEASPTNQLAVMDEGLRMLATVWAVRVIAAILLAPRMIVHKYPQHKYPQVEAPPAPTKPVPWLFSSMFRMYMKASPQLLTTILAQDRIPRESEAIFLYFYLGATRKKTTAV